MLVLMILYFQLHRSNVRQVTLRKVTLLTSGMYRCEVTSKLSPAGINSEFREDRMVVLGEFSTLFFTLDEKEAPKRGLVSQQGKSMAVNQFRL